MDDLTKSFENHKIHDTIQELYTLIHQHEGKIEHLSDEETNAINNIKVFADKLM